MRIHRFGSVLALLTAAAITTEATIAGEIAPAQSVRESRNDAAGVARRRPARHRPIWRPSIGASWQIQFQGALDTSVDADIYEIDGLDSTAETVALLHSMGRRAICYINAGAWEEWRADAAQFPPSVIGNEYAGWPGERWLDIRRIDLLGPILGARLDDCARKGFDAVDPDNLDGYTHPTGFPLTAEDQLRFNRFLAYEAHRRGLSIALKNDFEQAADLADDFDFAVAESCFFYSECGLLEPFTLRGKVVFDIEYTDNGMTPAAFCEAAVRQKISAILKNRNLDAWIVSCR